MRPISRLRHKNKAFTLVELIITIIVVGIVAIPLSLLISQHVESVLQSQDLTLAANLARFEMEVVNNLNYTSIVSANFPNYQGYAYNLSRIVTYAQGNATSPESLRRITVEVRKSGHTAILIGLVTYIARNVLYGI